MAENAISMVIDGNCMKKIIFLILAIVILGSCSNKQEIMGTWIDTKGQIWVFSADGELIYEKSNNYDIECYEYSITNKKLSLYFTGNSPASDTLQIYDIFMSADGELLILTNGKKIPGWSVAGPGWPENQLVKKNNNARYYFGRIE
jgi:hypothetical protein